MKKIFLITMVMVLAMSVLVGCNSNTNTNTEKTPENNVSDNSQTIENEQSAENNETNNNTTVQNSENVPVQKNPTSSSTDTKTANQQGRQTSASDKNSFIGEARAKKIALERAGVSAESVRFERTELDFDDGVWQYEVEFKNKNVEYSADIRATDGKILEFEKDIDD